MEQFIAKKLGSLAVHFPEWDNTMGRYDKYLYENNNEDARGKDVATVLEVHKILEAILKVCTESGHFKDAWEFSEELDLLLFGQDTVLRSRKMGVTFTIGIYHREIFLRADLHSPVYVKSMGDEFWSCFVELHSLGDFHFLENSVPSSQEARKIMKTLRNTKSSVFQIIRNYILFDVYEGGDWDSVDLGSLEIKWPLAVSWCDLIGKAAKAFRCLCKINYMLYRLDYERTR